MSDFAELVQWCLGSFWRWLGVLCWLSVTFAGLSTAVRLKR